MHDLLLKEFGIHVTEIKKIAGYDNQNFLVIANKEKYILKTYLFDSELLDLVNAENDVLLYLQEKKKSGIPKPIAFVDGSFVKVIDNTIFRLLSYLGGQFIAEATSTQKLQETLGGFLANLDAQLLDFQHYVFKARKWEWDIQYLHLNKKYIPAIPSAKNRSVVAYFFQQYEENVVPKQEELRKSVIHNDANEWNILTQNDHVTGIIDFGDLAYAPLINELAVAVTYACYGKPDSLENAFPILKAYHAILPLEEKEISVLYYLIAARLCISVCNSANAKKNDPTNAYALISEEKAWRFLYHLLTVNPIGFEQKIRESLGFSCSPQKTTDEALATRNDYLSNTLSVSYKQPVYLERSAFQYMYDVFGNTFLDAYNNIPHVGHSHPKVVTAGQRQMAKLNTNTRYLYDVLPAYAEKLLAKFPPKLNKVFFVNSGSEASDLAIRIAKKHTGYSNLMVMEHGYHGHTQTGIDISDYKFSNPKGQGQREFILKTTIPDTYQGKYTNNDGSAGKQYATNAIEYLKQSGAKVAAFISEPIVGCGGQVPLAKGYLEALYPAIRKQRGVCISDEVQTGFGRLGDCFWGFEQQGVVPDMVIIGKPMGNGHPMGAVITTTEIAESFAKGVEFFSSFGGNPVSCAIGLSVLEVIEEQQLQENALLVGNYYKSLFLNLKEKYPSIGDVRGSGLFLGVEIVNENTKTPDTELAQFIKNELRENYILISTDGPHDNVLKTKPPLIFTKENAKAVVDAVEAALFKRFEGNLT